MDENKRMFSLGEFNLIIIGTGVSAVYYFLDKATSTELDTGSYIAIAIILLSSVLAQFMRNSLNRYRTSLREANETLERKVFERTRKLLESENHYRSIFENTGAATVIIEKDMTISLANSAFAAMAGFA